MNEDNIYPILGLLLSKEMSGYEIKKLSDQIIKHFWDFEYSQIYPILEWLQKNELIYQLQEITKESKRKKKYI